MKTNNFMNQWLKLALKPIKMQKLESAIINNGHMGTHVFSYQDPVRQLSLGHFIRIMINYAMICKNTEQRQEFMDYWNLLGQKIVDFAESSDADEFNKQFAHKK